MTREGDAVGVWSDTHVARQSDMAPSLRTTVGGVGPSAASTTPRAPSPAILPIWPTSERPRLVLYFPSRNKVIGEPIARPKKIPLGKLCEGSINSEVLQCWNRLLHRRHRPRWCGRHERRTSSPSQGSRWSTMWRCSAHVEAHGKAPKKIAGVELVACPISPASPRSPSTRADGRRPQAGSRPQGLRAVRLPLGIKLALL